MAKEPILRLLSTGQDALDKLAYSQSHHDDSAADELQLKDPLYNDKNLSITSSGEAVPVVPILVTVTEATRFPINAASV